MATVVVVDDETLIAEALAFLLEDLGHLVHTAPDGRSAWELIGRVDVALVITDFMMPAMSGLELAAAIKAEPAYRHIPVVLLSAAQAAVGRAHSELFAAVFEKPCSPVELLGTVERLLNGSGHNG